MIDWLKKRPYIVLLSIGLLLALAAVSTKMLLGGDTKSNNNSTEITIEQTDKNNKKPSTSTSKDKSKPATIASTAEEGTNVKDDETHLKTVESTKTSAPKTVEDVVAEMEQKQKDMKLDEDVEPAASAPQETKSSYNGTVKDGAYVTEGNTSEGKLEPDIVDWVYADKAHSKYYTAEQSESIPKDAIVVLMSKADAISLQYKAFK